MSAELRKTERLDAEYLITVRVEGDNTANAFARAKMNNLGQGGLCFVAPHQFRPDQKLDIDFPASRPVVRLKARVIWCRPQRDQFSVGAEFVAMSEALRTRLIEMHRAIVEYQKMNNASGAAVMDTHQAAVEWLNLHAETFLAGVI
jgi:hypothetical protein